MQQPICVDSPIILLSFGWKLEVGGIASPTADEPVMNVMVMLDFEVLLNAIGRFGSKNWTAGLPPHLPSI